MYKFEPVNVLNKLVHIHPLRQIDVDNLDSRAHDLYMILSDEETTKYITEKRVDNKEIIRMWLLGATIAYKRQYGYPHYLTLTGSDLFVGMIDILTPKRVETDYRISDTWFIEYYLNKQLWGNGVMTSSVSIILNSLLSQGINKIGAVCIRENLPSIKVLVNCGFKNKGKLDYQNDFYEFSC